MYSAGSRKPYVPLSRNSIVYVYLTPATAFTQSSELPDATSAYTALVVLSEILGDTTYVYPLRLGGGTQSIEHPLSKNHHKTNWNKKPACYRKQ